MKKTFRTDINGLRAWAVVAVIFFHFGIPGFGGGFVGVDIFFVISGYLMTGIILKYLHNDSAKSPALFVFDFYTARAQRIIPALFFLCLVLMVVGYFYLPSGKYEQLSTHVIGALSFVSNILFWKESGYFDVSSHEKLLLHTWSLSVEWQFYIFLPVIVLLWWRFVSHKLAGFFILGFIISLLISIVGTYLKPTPAFFLLPTRAWEMLAGGLILLFGHRLHFSNNVQRWFEYAGYCIIVASIVLFDSSMQWPGSWAMVPVLGTCLVIVANQQQSIFSGHGIAQRLGDASYSLYLWHWPLCVVLVYLGLASSTTAIVFALIATLILGFLSYRYIETLTRQKLGVLNRPMFTSVALLALGLLIVPSIFVKLSDGLPYRLSSHIEAIFGESDNKNPRRDECHVAGSTPVPECHYGGDKLGVIVLGDSHAQAIIRSVEKSMADPLKNVLDWTLSSCPVIEGVKDRYDHDYRCGEFIEETLLKEKTLPNDVPMIIVNRLSATFFGSNELNPHGDLVGGAAPKRYITTPYDEYSNAYRIEMRDGVINTLCEIAENRTVYMVRPFPEMGANVPDSMGWAAMQGKEKHVMLSLEDYFKRHQYAWDTQDIAADRCGIKILNPLPYLCDSENCYGDVDGLPIYYDDDHLSERGGQLLIPMFRQVF